AADQPDLDRVVAGGVSAGQRTQAPQHPRADRRQRRRLEELATVRRGRIGCSLAHTLVLHREGKKRNFELRISDLSKAGGPLAAILYTSIFYPRSSTICPEPSIRTFDLHPRLALPLLIRLGRRQLDIIGLQRAQDPKTDEQRIGMEPAALGELRILN